MSKNKEEYNKYLLSKEWQAKRLACFKLYGKRCYLCQSEKKIHVHHRTYKNLYDEDVEKQLIPLCEKHHSFLHKYCLQNKLTIWNGTIKYFKYFQRIGKSVSRKVKLRRNKKKQLVEFRKVQKPKHPKKKKVKTNTQADVDTFKEMLRQIEAERHLPEAEKLRLMHERVAKRREDRQNKNKPHLSNNQLRKKKRYERIKQLGKTN